MVCSIWSGWNRDSWIHKESLFFDEPSGHSMNLIPVEGRATSFSILPYRNDLPTQSRRTKRELIPFILSFHPQTTFRSCRVNWLSRFYPLVMDRRFLFTSSYGTLNFHRAPACTWGRCRTFPGFNETPVSSLLHWYSLAR